MRATESRIVQKATPPERVSPSRNGPAAQPGIPITRIETRQSDAIEDPRLPRGLSRAVEIAASAPALPPVADLDRILLGVRAMIEAPDTTLPDELKAVARTILDDELSRMAPLLERRAAVVDT